ncbi:hypothetical protein AB0395_06345 [Streptosporangium sp. NPDC051023]|uniref:hypothetical protein n=1 Tax=Streptosporangium sp. NPDC051023 TaxID=3155410 RepID=UPI00344FCFEA
MSKHFVHIVRGTGARPPLAHGGGSGADDFGMTIDDLARTRSTIAPGRGNRRVPVRISGVWR